MSTVQVLIQSINIWRKRSRQRLSGTLLNFWLTNMDEPLRGLIIKLISKTSKTLWKLCCRPLTCHVWEVLGVKSNMRNKTQKLPFKNLNFQSRTFKLYCRFNLWHNCSTDSRASSENASTRCLSAKWFSLYQMIRDVSNDKAKARTCEKVNAFGEDNSNILGKFFSFSTGSLNITISECFLTPHPSRRLAGLFSFSFFSGEIISEWESWEKRVWKCHDQRWWNQSVYIGGDDADDDCRERKSSLNLAMILCWTNLVQGGIGLCVAWYHHYS